MPINKDLDNRMGKFMTNLLQNLENIVTSYRNKNKISLRPIYVHDREKKQSSNRVYSNVRSVKRQTVSKRVQGN